MRTVKSVHASMLSVKIRRKQKSVTTADNPASDSRAGTVQQQYTVIFFLISCVHMNVGTMVAVLFYVYNNKPVALKKKKSELCFFLFTAISTIS